MMRRFLFGTVLVLWVWGASAAWGEEGGYASPRLLHDTPSHNLGRKLLPRFSPGGAEHDGLIAPAAEAAQQARLTERLFARSAVTFLNAVVAILPPDRTAALFDEPVTIARELLADRTSDASLAALVALHRDGLLLPLADFTEAGGALDMETGLRFATPLIRDVFDLSADARVPRVIANVHQISKAELDFSDKTAPDVALTLFGIARVATDITPEDYERSLDLLDTLYRGDIVGHFVRYAQANYPFASAQNPIIALADPLECIFDPKGRRGLYRSARTTGLLIAHFKALEDFASLSLDNLDRFTEPAGLQMVHNVFRYPRLPQLIEGYHIAVEQGKFDPVIERIARIAAGEPVAAAKNEEETSTDEAPERDRLLGKFEEYMKSGQRARLVLFLTGQTLALLGELGDVRLKSEPGRTMLNESIDFVTYLLVGDTKAGIPPVADPLLDSLYDVLLDEAKGERFLRVLQEGSRILLDPPNGLDVKDLDNQLSDILRCDPKLLIAGVVRDQLDGDPKNGDARPAVPILKLIAKADPELVALSLSRYGEIVREGHEAPFLTFLKRVYEAEKPDWYPTVSLSEEIFAPKRGGKSIFERSGQILAYSLPEARGKSHVLKGILSKKHEPDLIALYGAFQRFTQPADKKTETGSIVERLSPAAVTVAGLSNPLTGRPTVDDILVVLDAAHHAELDETVLDLLVLLERQGQFSRKRKPNIYDSLEQILDEVLRTRAEQHALYERIGPKASSAKAK